MIAAIERHQTVFNKNELLADDNQACTSISKVASLDNADKDSLSFLANPRYKQALTDTGARVVLVDESNADGVSARVLAIVVSSPYLAYAAVSQLMENEAAAVIHPSAIIHPSAQIGRNVAIGAYSVIEADAVIGDGCQIGVGVHIGQAVHIGARTAIGSHAVIAHDCTVGDDCRIHSHASIGSDGFGFAPKGNPASDGWVRIAQLGRVLIGNRVRIGSSTCIDRGAIEDTVIADDVIIDNLVQIAHNVKIGQGTAIAAATGIAGSTTIGKGCIIGGAVGIAGHLTIADFVTLTGRTFVTKSIHQAGSYSSGTVAMPTQKWRRAAVRFRQMGDSTSENN